MPSPTTMAAQTPLAPRRRQFQQDPRSRAREARECSFRDAACARRVGAGSGPRHCRRRDRWTPGNSKAYRARMSADRSITRARDQLAARKDGRHVDMQRHLADGAAVSHRRYAAVDASSIAAQATALPRTIVKPSVAGAYSPLRPAQLGTHDYASMDMSAGVGSSGRAQAAQMAQSAQWSQVAEEVQQARDAERRRDAQDAQPIEKAQRGNRRNKRSRPNRCNLRNRRSRRRTPNRPKTLSTLETPRTHNASNKRSRRNRIQQAQEPKPAQPAQQAKPAQQAQQPQPPSSANPSPNTSPQWINRLSQRRVTEVPDQFTR